MSPHCDDETKYGIVDKMVEEYEGLNGTEILGRKVVDVNTVNGARVTLEDGSWVLIRASSNKPELVVVVESMASEDDMDTQKQGQIVEQEAIKLVCWVSFFRYDFLRRGKGLYTSSAF